MRNILIACQQKRIILYDLKLNKPLKYIFDCDNIDTISMNDHYDYISYCYSNNVKFGIYTFDNLRINNSVFFNFSSNCLESNDNRKLNML